MLGMVYVPQVAVLGWGSEVRGMGMGLMRMVMSTLPRFMRPSSWILASPRLS